MLAFLQMGRTGIWSAEDIIRWTDMVKVKGALNANGRKTARNLTDEEDGGVNWDNIQLTLTEEAIEAGLTSDLDWFEENLTATKKAPAKFPLTIARNRGAESLMETPKICIGTVHSVKGAEADVVYLFPDVSKAGMREWNGGPTQQAPVYRLFYVAMTRARDTLVLCAPSEEYAVNLDN